MGEQVTQWSKVALNSFSALGQTFMSFIPNLVGALVLLIIGIVVASLFRKLVVRALTAIKFDAMPAKVFGQLNVDKLGTKVQPSVLAGKMTYWIIMLIFLVTIAETLGWTVVSEKISELIGYIPRLFSAVLIFVVGYYIANFVSKALEAGFGTMSMDSGKMISRAAFFIILAFITLTALDQAGVDTTLLTANLSIIIAGVVIAFSVAFAWAIKGSLQNILTFHHSRNQFKVGQQIQIGDVHGVIQQLDHMHLVIRSANDDVVIPVREISEKQVTVKRSSTTTNND